MMSRFLLLLCFTTVHVLGDGENNISAKKNDILAPVNATSQQKFSDELPVMLDKTATPVQHVLLSDEAVENNTKSESTTSATASSTSTSDDSTVVSTTSAPTTMTKASPTTSTSSPTTSTSSTTTSTSSPTTSSTAFSIIRNAPITTNSPITTMLPPPSTGKWIVNQTDMICIVVQMSVLFNVSYVNVNRMNSSKVFDMPIDNATTKASGSCGNLEQTLTLTWSSDNVTNSSMTLHFMKNVSESRYSLHHLEVVLPATDFSDANLTGPMILVHEAPNFAVGLSNSYRCMKDQMIHLKRNGTNEDAGYLAMASLQFQAFKPDNSTVFGLAKDCAFDTPDIVPIAIGCVLAGSVVIVLISYLVGRRRREARGYLSM